MHAPVTVDFISGEEVVIDKLAADAVIRDLRQCLREEHPVAKGTAYELLDASSRHLDDGELVPDERLTALLVQRVMNLVVGRWQKDSGDNYFIGLEIQSDGSYECNRGQVTDGRVRVISEDERKINLKRTILDANDHIFVVDESGERMTGQCPQSGCKWTLTKLAEASA